MKRVCAGDGTGTRDAKAAPSTRFTMIMKVYNHELFLERLTGLRFSQDELR